MVVFNEQNAARNMKNDPVHSSDQKSSFVSEDLPSSERKDEVALGSIRYPEEKQSAAITTVPSNFKHDEDSAHFKINSSKVAQTPIRILESNQSKNS